MLSNATVATAIPVSDMERAKNFYQNVLGLNLETDDPDAVIFGAAGGTQVFLYPTPNAGQNPATYAGFHVEDLTAEMADLRAKGVVFEEYDDPNFATIDGVAEHPGGRSAWFKDSEGNILALNEWT